MINEKKYIVIIFIFMAISIFGFLLGNGFSDNGNDLNILYDESLLSFNEKWTVSINGQNEPATDLPNYVNAASGDMVVMTNYLPAALADGSYIALKNYYSEMRIYINNELFYESEQITLANGNTQPIACWEFIPLGSAFSQNLIKIETVSPYHYYAGILPGVIIGTHSEALLYASSKAAINTQISICIVVLGFVIFLFSLIAFSNEKSSHSFIYLGIAIALLGLCLITRIDVPRTSIKSYYVNYYISNISLRLIPIIYLFFLCVRNSGKNIGYFKILLRINFAVFFVSLVLHLTAVADFTATVRVAYFDLGVVFISAFVHDILSEGSLRYKILISCGMIPMIVLTGINVFTHFAYTSSFKLNLSCIGALIFSLFQTIAILISAYNLATEHLITARQLSESRTKLMVSQIQPHFIYNSLATIRAMIKYDPQKAYSMIYDFSSYLSFNINALEDVKVIPFYDELKHIQIYTQIESERFSDRLNIIYEINADRFVVPPLSVQPFVENAIKHGVCEKAEGGTVRIESEEHANCFTLTISDDGVGFDLSYALKRNKTSGTGIGIKNASFRLKKLINAKIDIKSMVEKGTTVTITIPKNHNGGTDENDIGR